MQLEIVNQARELDGLPPLTHEVVTQRKPSPQDPIMVWERSVMRVSGGTDEELAQLGFRNVTEQAERRVDKHEVMYATAAITRIESDGKFVSRADGGDQSTAAILNRYIHDEPGGPLRTRYAPTDADKRRGGMVILWGINRPAGNDFERAMAKTLRSTGLTSRDAGTAAAAFAGYDRHMAHRAREKERMAAMSGAAAPASTGGQGLGGARRPSQWFGARGGSIWVPATVERVQPLHYRDPNGGGLAHLYILRTQDGDAVKWLCPEDKKLEPGREITLYGEVVDHLEFNGEKQTEIKHGSFISR